jgi:cell division septation protein DedD
LPPNIQQMSGRDVSPPIAPVTPQTSTPQSSVQTPAPYVPQTPNKNKKISDTAGANKQPYQVMAKYVNPIGFEKIRTILPDATRAGDRIVLGNFSEKSPAKDLVKKLKQQGIEAWLKNS